MAFHSEESWKTKNDVFHYFVFQIYIYIHIVYNICIYIIFMLMFIGSLLNHVLLYDYVYIISILYVVTTWMT